MPPHVSIDATHPIAESKDDDVCRVQKFGVGNDSLTRRTLPTEPRPSTLTLQVNQVTLLRVNFNFFLYVLNLS